MSISRFGFGLLASLFAGHALATPITSTVGAGGKVWAQPNLFVGLSWIEIDEACPAGALSCTPGSTLNGFTMTGWTWASVEDVGELFAATTPHPGGRLESFSEQNSAWAPAFFDVVGFEPTPSFGDTLIRIMRGYTSTLFDPNLLPAEDRVAFTGFVRDCNDDCPPSGEDLVSTRFGAVVTGPDTISAPPGAFFYRTTAAVAVPEPTLSALLGMGLAGLWLARRRSSGTSLR